MPPVPIAGIPSIKTLPCRSTFMTRNLLHLARMIKDAGGIPAHGN